MSQPQVSEVKLAANRADVNRADVNRANAQHSTGPKSEAGKAKVSLNAVKSGLTGRTVLLPNDDAAAYEATIARLVEHWQPATEQEKALVQSLADTDWRLARIPTLESGLYATGELQFANEHGDIEDPQVRRMLIQTRVFLCFERQLKNLSLQESRLRRQREKDEARLREMQEARLAPQRRLDAAARAFICAALDRRQPFDPAPFGFEFSLPQIIDRARQLRPDLVHRPTEKNTPAQTTAA